ncbi:C-terminal binding protein [Streptomyces sp. MAR4 CNX-425]|uniref:C-terminal binding protein n=1 Tax=Streptomyces sp. MAR4 CNX-425 TaxID=3406343 RepID=UPI003B5009C2
MSTAARKLLVVTDMTFPDDAAERRAAAAADADYARYDCTGEAETARAVRGADVALVNFAPVTDAVLAALAPGATVVRYGIGVDNVDLGAAAARGVRLANVTDYGSDTVADHAAAVLLALLRKLPAYHRTIAGGGWGAPSDQAPLRALHATTVGLIGTGRIGRALAARLAPFGMTVLGHDPYADPAALARAGIAPVGLDELLSRAHAVSLHAPATAETHHLIDAETLARLPRGAVLVNTARGSLVDTGAVVAALRSGRLGGAGLDVVEDEPLPAASELRSLPNVVLTPHAAFYSEQSVERLQQLAADEARRALLGEPLRSPVPLPAAARTNRT